MLLSVKRNFLSNIISKFSSSFIQLFLVPVFISYWGKEYYGEWLLLSTIPSYLQAADFGLSVTATTAICSLIANKQSKEALSLYQSANRLFLYLTLTLLSLFVISCLSWNWAELVGSRFLNNTTIIISLFFLLLNISVTFFLGLALGIYRAEGRFDISQNIMTVLQVVEGVNMFFNLLLNGSILTISVSGCIIRFVCTLYVINNLQKKYHWFNFSFNQRIHKVFHLLPTSVFYMIITLGQGLMLQGTTFIIGKQLGASVLVTFNTTRTLINSVKSFVSAFYFSFLPEFTVLITTKNTKKATLLFIKMFLVSFVLTLLLILFYFFTGDIIMFYWTNNKVKIEPLFYVFMLLIAFFSTLSNCAYTVLNATNQNQIIGKYYTALAVVGSVSIYYTAHRGILFIAMILTIFEFLLLIVSLKETRRILRGISSI